MIIFEKEGTVEAVLVDGIDRAELVAPVRRGQRWDLWWDDNSDRSMEKEHRLYFSKSFNSRDEAVAFIEDYTAAIVKGAWPEGVARVAL